MLINNPVDTEYAELSTQAIYIFKEEEVYDLISRIAAIYLWDQIQQQLLRAVKGKISHELYLDEIVWTFK